MKMGIKEFRERISEVTDAGEAVLVTNHGHLVGSYLPLHRKDPERIRKAATEMASWQDDARSRGVDLDKMLTQLGLDHMGSPIDAAGR